MASKVRITTAQLARSAYANAPKLCPCKDSPKHTNTPLQVLKNKSGVIYGDDVTALFKHAQENTYAIPAVNVTSSSTVVATLEAAKKANSPIILQVSQGGAAYFAGKGLDLSLIHI